MFFWKLWNIVMFGSEENFARPCFMNVFILFWERKGNPGFRAGWFWFITYQTLADYLMPYLFNTYISLDGNYTRMLRAILNQSWRQHPTKRQLYGHLPPIMKTIYVRRTRYAGQCWKSRDELISEVLLWTQTYGRANAGRPARTYIQQLCEDTWCSPKDLQEAMNDREKWW